MSQFCGVESLERRTMLAANLVADIGGVYPENSVTVANGETFFIANDGKHGDQLWISDGTVAGTHMVTIISKDGIGLPTLVPFEDGVAMLGNEIGLWKSDGTAAGTVEIAARPDSALIDSLESVNDHLTFISTPNVPSPTSATIWASDGTVGNLTSIEQLNNVTLQTNLATYIYAPAVIGNRVIYTNIYGAQGGVQLWSTDGTAAGTFQLGGDGDDAVGQLGPGGNYLFWQYNAGLFSTDGTATGTQLISNVVSLSEGTYGESSIDPSELPSYIGAQTIADGRYFFTGPVNSGSQDDSSTQVWESDGTAAGTHLAFTVNGFFSEVASSGNGVVVFAYSADHFNDSDGSPDVSATYTLYNFDPDSGQLSTIYQFGDPGIVKNVIEVDNSVYFYYWDGATQNTIAPSYSDMPNFQLWRTDGTSSGTSYIQTYSYWPELTAVGEDVMVSDYPSESAGTQIIEPEAPTTVQGMTQNAVSLVGGILRVFGTNGDDNIRIYQLDSDPSRLVIDLNGVKHSFEMDSISEIKVYGEDGNDSIAVVESHGALHIRTYVDGGAGNDTIYTGCGSDTIFGGAGNDLINGGNNGDLIDGGDGNDTIFGGNGNDTINGGDGADYIEGNKGDNMLTGGDDDCANTIIGTGGQDVLFGQAAIDVFFNGSNQTDPLDTILD
jgi:ELWxxDGT repeat protein